MITHTRKYFHILDQKLFHLLYNSQILNIARASQPELLYQNKNRPLQILSLFYVNTIIVKDTLFY